MKKRDILMYIANNNGTITSKQAREENISLRTLQRLEKEGSLERLTQGLYLHKDFFPDPFYLAQYRSSKAIFSHQTALYLHSLSDENPHILTMTVPSGWNSNMLEEKGLYKFYYNKKDLWKLGQIEVKSPYGHIIRTYDKERTLCDCISKIDEVGRNLVIKAVTSYMEDKNKVDINKLYEYAKVLRVKDVVRTYLEIIMEYI